MYGYVIPDKPNLLMKEFSLYRAHYCGVCRAMAALFGQIPRLTVNYDITFFSLLMFDLTGTDAEFQEKRCAAHGFKMTGNVKRNKLLDKIAALNVLMSYRNLKDDIVDGGLKKAAPAMLLKHANKKAARLLPGADDMIKRRYASLIALEKENCVIVDMAADCFAAMMRDAGREILEEKFTESTGEFLYNLGRWVYLADALDDIDEDFKKKNYNPYLKAHNNFINRRQFIKDNFAEVSAPLYGSVNRMAELLQGFNLTKSRNLLRNIVIYGIRNKTEQLLKSEKKLPKEKI